MLMLKELTIKNIEEIKEVILDAFSGEPWNDDWKDANQFHQYILDLIGNKNSLSLGLYEEEKLVGVSLGRIKHWYSGNQYWIDDLGVLHSEHGKGYGTAFLRKIEEYMSLNGLNKIVLLTEEDFPAYYFYQKNSFDEKKDRVVFEKKI